MNQQTVRVLVGAPGSGKTTWCQRNEPTLGALLSLDEARREITGDAANQSVNAEAADWVHAEADAALADGFSVTIDATGATPEHRARWVDLARQHGARPVAVLFRVPLRVCLKRNRRRERRVPEAALRRIWEQTAGATRVALRREGFSETVQVGTTSRS